jgi:hypothetical protein
MTINFLDIFPGSYSDKSAQSASPKIRLFVAGYLDFFDTQTTEWFGLEIWKPIENLNDTCEFFTYK